MRKRITLLVVALMLALTMSFGVAGGAFAAKSTTFSKGACVTKAGQGQGGGEIKDQHHGACNSNGSSF
jgi:cytochrome b